MSKKYQDSQRTLLLNADGTALHICSSMRAVVLCYAGKADMVLGTGKMLHSKSHDIEIPSVIVLRQYVNAPRNTSVKLTPKTVLARDKRKCAFQIPKLCEGTATTIDHVYPRGKAVNGKTPDGHDVHSWENVVAACRKCNHKKGDRLLEDLGWELKNKPFRPKGPGAKLLLHATDPAWEPFLKF